MVILEDETTGGWKGLAIKMRLKKKCCALYKYVYINVLFVNVRKILTLPGCLRESTGAPVQGGLDFALDGASGSEFRLRKRSTLDALRVSGGRNGPDDSDSTRLFNTARLRSTPAGALYGISLYSFLRILPPLLFRPHSKSKCCFPRLVRRSLLSSVARMEKKKKRRGRRRTRARLSPAVIAVWPSRYFFFFFLFFLDSRGV